MKETIKELRRLQDFLLDQGLYTLAAGIATAMIHIQQGYEEERLINESE